MPVFHAAEAGTGIGVDGTPALGGVPPLKDDLQTTDGPRAFEGNKVIDHIGISVRDDIRSKAFYQAALTPLGHELVMEFEGAGGFGAESKPDFWREDVVGPHPAFMSRSGARTGPFTRPPSRPADGTTARLPPYYAAFVIDPEGHDIEAVCHAPE